MKLAQKMLSTISMNLENRNQTLATEILRDIRNFYKDNSYTELEGLLNQAINEILLNHGNKL